MEKSTKNYQNIDDLVRSLSEKDKIRYDELEKRRKVIDDLIKQHNDNIAEWNRIIDFNPDRSENLDKFIEIANQELVKLRIEYKENIEEVKMMLGIDKTTEETMKETGDKLIESFNHASVVDPASGLVTNPDRLRNENA